MGISKLCMQGDSKLINKKVNEKFAFKETSLVSYQIDVQKLLKSFLIIWFEYVMRVHNKHAATLAAPGLRIDVVDEAVDVRIIRRTLRAIIANLVLLIHLISKIGEVYYLKFESTILNCGYKIFKLLYCCQWQTLPSR